ncbi:MAG: histidine phosphatase family protein [Deltaproteobacteria bacterium]|nr:histidine phosphatase family protein [Deltaproteobacteria bacterium]
MRGDFIYIIMVGLPARGKTTLSGKLQDSLRRDGIRCRVFNNGDLRRKLSKDNTSYPEFFDPKNKIGAALRERYAMMNLNHARTFVEGNRGKPKAAIIDATNVSSARRRMLLNELPEDRVLFIECINEDRDILDENIRYKVCTPEFSHLSTEEAIISFRKRIQYYQGIYTPLRTERNFVKVNTFHYRILEENLNDGVPFYDRIRDFLVTPFIKNLFLIRHGETYFNLEDRIGGDSGLTVGGLDQARALARHFKQKRIPLIFTSDRKRTIQTAIPIQEEQQGCKIITLEEFNEIDSGVCEGMSYAEIREKMPHVSATRKKDKYNYEYPEGEGYVSMEERIKRGVKKVLYLSSHSENIMIIGHRAVNRMILAHFVFKRKEDVPYIYVPQDKYYHMAINQNKKLFQLKKYS